MDEERVLEEIVTKLFLNTCRLRPQLNEPTVQAAVLCASTATLQPTDDAEARVIPLTTGSVAEFYIEPMLPHFGDIDVMYHRCTMLAIPRGQSPPTQLPAEFHNYVQVYEIIDSHFPGYVYLELRCLLTECNDNSKYNAVDYDRGQYLFAKFSPDDECVIKGPENYLFHRKTADHQRQEKIHGPAVNVVQIGTQLSCDKVSCVRCLSWPSQAADWPTRHRNYDWPDSATIDRVINNGCDVVPVAHRLCRQDKWMGKYQQRLSFSRAEIVLINSWMPVQQIVYHMLRVFMKDEQLTDGADDSGAQKMSSYHIKTLMLWACEMKPKHWWTDDLNLIRICMELLHNLAVWLTEARCPHYFINEYNLIDSSFTLDMFRPMNQLMSISKSWLSSWFVNNYIRKCSQLCPRNVSRLFDDVSTNARLQNAVSAIVSWRLNVNTVYKSVMALAYADGAITLAVSRHSLTIRSLRLWLKQLSKVSECLSIHFIAVAFLHIAYKISRNGFTDDLMDVLAASIGQFTGPLRYYNQRSSLVSLSLAAKLMKVVANNSLRDVPLIEFELSEAYLYRALRCKDSDSDSIYCLANVNLAVLYYTTGQYQTAIDHCTLVTRSQDHSQCSSHVVQGELLPNIDEDIDIMLGLAVFYQHVRTAALNQKHAQHVTVFTTELFAHYLHIKCLSIEKCQQLSDTAQSQSSTYQVQSYVKYLSDMQQLYIADALLWKSINGCCPDVRSCNQEFSKCQDFRRCPNELSTSQLVEFLQQSAVEHLTTFRQVEVRDFGSVVPIVTTDFEAMYAYKRGDYQRCLQLSTQNVHTLLYAANMFEVHTCPEFIQLLDDDIVSLTALTLIVDPDCRDYTNRSCITQLTLSLYLITQCQLKLRHSVTSLAQTLNYIKVAQRRIPVHRTLDQLTLKLTTRCMLRHFRIGLSSE